MNVGALVVGEALLDTVVEGDRVTRHPGGSPANVALGLARLGVATRLHTAIGDDDDGRLIREHLGRSGVELSPASTIDAPTSRAIATVGDDGSASYAFALAWNPRPLDDAGAPAVVHAGSLGAFLSPGAAVVDGILRRAGAAGAVISIDPNIRPALVGDPDAARARFAELASAAQLVKLSDEDAAFLFPGRTIDDVLDLLVGDGAAVAGVTRGSAGAALASGDARVTVPPVVTAVADTVGAGDSFMAALIHALVGAPRGWDGRPVDPARLADAGAEAARAAAITVSRPGADLPTLHELRTPTERR